MKKFVYLISAFLLVALIACLQFVSADLNITAGSGFTAQHGTTLTIPINVTNTNITASVSNVTLLITNITNSSQFFPITITDATKKSIASGATVNYTINYPIPLYLKPSIYYVNISVSANDSSLNYLGRAIIAINVSENASFDVTDSLTISASSGMNKSETFDIKNTGNVNLSASNILPEANLTDGKNNTINISIKASQSVLIPGDSATITVTAKVPKKQLVGTYTTGLILTAAEGLIKNITLNINVKTTLCEFGIVGDYFSVEIKTPDSGDDFYPGDKIPVEVKVRNYDDDDEQDVVVIADLFDETDNKFLDVGNEVTGVIDSDSSEYFYPEIEVPFDADETHSYVVYVKAYEDDSEDEQCNENYVSVDIKKETHSIVIDSINVPEFVSCDQGADFSIKLANAGKKDEDVKITVSNSELGISSEKTLSLDAGDDTEVDISALIPKNATEKNYTINVKAQFYYYDNSYHDSDSESVILTVEGGCIAREVSISASSTQAYSKEQTPIAVTLFNTGQISTTYTISASGYESWATLDKINPIILTLNKDESGTSTIYLTPIANVTGDKTFKVKVIYSGNVIEKDVVINVKEKVSALKFYQVIAQKLSNLSGLDFATINIVLIVAIILLFIWLTRAKRY